MFAVIALARVALTSPITGPADAWFVLRSDVGKFTVRMPAPTEEKIDEVPTETIRLVRHTYSCSTEQAHWQVAFVDFSAAILNPISVGGILQSAQNGARSEVKDQVFSEGNGRKDGRHWRRFRVQPRKGPAVSHFMVVDGQRLYHLQVVSPPDRFRKVGTRAFFDSFVIDPADGSTMDFYKP